MTRTARDLGRNRDGHTRRTFRMAPAGLQSSRTYRFNVETVNRIGETANMPCPVDWKLSPKRSRPLLIGFVARLAIGFLLSFLAAGTCRAQDEFLAGYLIVPTAEGQTRYIWSITKRLRIGSSVPLVVTLHAALRF